MVEFGRRGEEREREMKGEEEIFKNPYPARTKVVSLGHQYRASPACTSVQSDQTLLLADQLKSSS